MQIPIKSKLHKITQKISASAARIKKEKKMKISADKLKFNDEWFEKLKAKATEPNKLNFQLEATRSSIKGWAMTKFIPTSLVGLSNRRKCLWNHRERFRTNKRPKAVLIAATKLLDRDEWSAFSCLKFHSCDGASIGCDVTFERLKKRIHDTSRQSVDESVKQKQNLECLKSLLTRLVRFICLQLWTFFCCL